MSPLIMCNCGVPDSDWNLKDYLPLISSSIVIILFIIDRFISSRIRKKEMERNFYYKVLLEPNLDLITSFFTEIEELYQNSSVKLSNLNEELFSEYLKELRLEVELFKNKRRKFEFHVVFPIQQRYPNGAEGLLSSLDDIQDFYITELDLMHFDSESIVLFNKELHLQKAKFLSNLYKPLG